MRVGLGGLTCQRYPGDPRPDVERYAEAVAIAEEAERLGFDSVWTSEHHFLDDSFLPSVLPFLAAVAARTDRILVGSDVILAPLHETLRLAEDAAVVDLLSGGRLVLGVAQGWRPEEFDGLGVPLRGRHRLFEEQVATLRQAWSHELVRGVSVTPKPAQPNGPPIWIGADSEPATRRAGRIGDGFIAGWSPPDDFRRQVEWVRGGLAEAGREAAGFSFAVSLPTFAYHERSEWTRALPHFWYALWRYDVIGDHRGRVGQPQPAPPPTPETDERLRAVSAIGTPDEVAERIREYADAAGPDFHFIADICMPGLDGSPLREALARFAEEVIPELR